MSENLADFFMRPRLITKRSQRGKRRKTEPEFFLGGGGVGCKVSTKFAAKTVLGLEGERIKKLSEYCILSTGKEEEDGAV